MNLVIVIPTYNEKETIALLCDAISDYTYSVQHEWNIHILVVDDNSPDGTHAIVARRALQTNESNPSVHLLLRRENRGRGWAGIDGFKHALQYNPDYIMEMDADFSHHPKYISDFLAAAHTHDVVIGSRYISGGKDIDRGILRRKISAFAQKYLAWMLGITEHDPTSGYRLFSRHVIETILPHCSARDPFIVTEMLFYIHQHHFSVGEIPIVFEDRKAGTSKLGFITLLRYVENVWKLAIKSRHKKPPQ